MNIILQNEGLFDDCAFVLTKEESKLLTDLLIKQLTHVSHYEDTVPKEEVKILINLLQDPFYYSNPNTKHTGLYLNIIKSYFKTNGIQL